MNTKNLKKTLLGLVIAGSLATTGLISKTLYEMSRYNPIAPIEERIEVDDKVRTYADLSIGFAASTLMAGFVSYAAKKTYPSKPKVTPSLSDVMESQNYLEN